MNRVTYFEQEGRQNLPEVLNKIKKDFKTREEIRGLKIVIFTSQGEGPALAYNKLKEFTPKIIAVTFPPAFSIKSTGKDGTSIETSIGISENLKQFFAGVQIPVLSARLPFEGFEGAEAIKQHMKLIKDVLSLFGGGFSLCIQAVLQACDMGAIRVGEKVVALSGDCAAVITASDTGRFLSHSEGLSINEILCKPRNLTISRKPPAEPVKVSGNLFAIDKEIKLLPPK
jgi:hypothetical protein